MQVNINAETAPGNINMTGLPEGITGSPDIEIVKLDSNNNRVEANILSNKDDMKQLSNNNINISIPTDLLIKEGTVDINLSIGRSNGDSVATGNNATESTNSDLFEIAKVDREQAVNYDDCQGYLPDFLGVNIPMPQPLKILEQEIALEDDKTSELKYYNYSVIFNRVKKMPVISAVNVAGDAKMRKDNSKRPAT